MCKCPQLIELHLPGSGHLSSAALVLILERLPTLEVLGLRGCERVTTGLASIAANTALYTRLRQLELSHCSLAIDEDVSRLLSKLPSLRVLDADFCSLLTDAVLESLPPSLEALSVLGCLRMSFDRLQEVEGTLGPKLKSDDTAVLSCLRGKNIGPSLVEMLLNYRQEECRRC